MYRDYKKENKLVEMERSQRRIESTQDSQSDTMLYYSLLRSDSPLTHHLLRYYEYGPSEGVYSKPIHSGTNGKQHYWSARHAFDVGPVELEPDGCQDSPDHRMKQVSYRNVEYLRISHQYFLTCLAGKTTDPLSPLPLPASQKLIHYDRHRGHVAYFETSGAWGLAEDRIRDIHTRYVQGITRRARRTVHAIGGMLNKMSDNELLSLGRIEVLRCTWYSVMLLSPLGMPIFVTSGACCQLSHM